MSDERPSISLKTEHRSLHGNSIYLAAVGTDRPLAGVPTAIPLTSSICQQAYFTLEQFRFWMAALRESPRFHRKLWEFFFIAQALFERGYLREGMAGIGFGVGLEPLSALFASYGARVLATDQEGEQAMAQGWTKTGEHAEGIARLNIRGICDETKFRELATFAFVDMNAVPTHLAGKFDFCWSSCSLEHLGSLRAGMDFVHNSLSVLRPNGLAVHTTEFNLSCDTDTVESPALSIYRERDIRQLITELEECGHKVEPMDWSRGEGIVDSFVDLPPFQPGEPHLRLRLASFDCTSIGLIIRKAG